MRYVTVYKDLSRIHPKVLFNLTKRQLICFGLAGAVGLPFYWYTHNFLGNDVSVLLMMVLCAPFLLAAVYRNRKTGEPFEKILFHILRAKFLYPQARPFRSENLYAMIQRQIHHETEAKCIAKTKARQGPVRQPAVRRSTGGASRKGRAK
ncbi:MAG: PrgI family protein [Ethanoligenens sp.]